MSLDPSKICYVFDVDGTLTEPRQPMSKVFESEFHPWLLEKQCYIATGSDYSKLLEQFNTEILSSFDTIFCCMGNETRSPSGKILTRTSFKTFPELISELTFFEKSSAFPYRTSQHFEERTGMLNFSVIGRGASLSQRKEYTEWDRENLERQNIAKYINDKYPSLEASVGGSISIDIIKKGHDKGQVIRYLKSNGAKKIVFVGDRCLPGGNDYGIIRELKKSNLAFEWYEVTSPEDTRKLIKTNGVFE